MIDKSFALTLTSYLFAFGLIVLKVQFNYEIDDSTWNIILSITGMTTFGGIANATRKQYLNIKDKLATK